MNIAGALAVSAAALSLAACQTTQTEANYVKVRPGPKIETAIAQCKEISSKARHFVIGIGGPEMLVVGLVGTAIATAAKQALVFEQCMVAQGYGKAGAKPEPAAASAGGSPKPAAAPVTSAPGPSKPHRAKPRRATPKPAEPEPAREQPKTAPPSPTA